MMIPFPSIFIFAVAAAMAAAAATVPQAGTNDYIFSIPRQDGRFLGKVQGPGTGRAMRQEDMTWIHEAIAERRALLFPSTVDLETTNDVPVREVSFDVKDLSATNVLDKWVTAVTYDGGIARTNIVVSWTTRTNRWAQGTELQPALAGRHIRSGVLNLEQFNGVVPRLDQEFISDVTVMGDEYFGSATTNVTRQTVPIFFTTSSVMDVIEKPYTNGTTTAYTNRHYYTDSSNILVWVTNITTRSKFDCLIDSEKGDSFEFQVYTNVSMRGWYRASTITNAIEQLKRVNAAQVDASVVWTNVAVYTDWSYYVAETMYDADDKGATSISVGDESEVVSGSYTNITTLPRPGLRGSAIKTLNVTSLWTHDFDAPDEWKEARGSPLKKNDWNYSFDHGLGDFICILPIPEATVSAAGQNRMDLEHSHLFAVAVAGGSSWLHRENDSQDQVYTNKTFIIPFVAGRVEGGIDGQAAIKGDMADVLEANLPTILDELGGGALGTSEGVVQHPPDPPSADGPGDDWYNEWDFEETHSSQRGMSWDVTIHAVIGVLALKPWTTPEAR